MEKILKTTIYISNLIHAFCTGSQTILLTYFIFNNKPSSALLSAFFIAWGVFWITYGYFEEKELIDETNRLTQHND